MKKKVLLAANISDTFKEYLLAQQYELVVWNGQQIPEDLTAIVTSNKLKLDKDLLEPLKELRWIGRLGSGIEIIDTAYCNARSIAFASSPWGIANAVAEHCIAMLLSLGKRVTSSFQEVQQQEWIREPNRGWELEGKTVGIIGYGNTGSAFARKLSVFGVRVLAYDKYKKDFSDEWVQETDLIELQQQADIISFHIPLNKETEGYYDHAFIQNCKEHMLLNTARGAIVVTQDLLSALETRRVLGAALDVLDVERQLTDKTSKAWEVVQELLRYNVLVTPHIAGYSHNAIEKMSAELMGKLKEVI